MNSITNKNMKNIHILPTDKPSRLRITSKGKLILSTIAVGSKGETQNIYITSDEEIKVGDWCHTIGTSLFNEQIGKVTKKVIEDNGKYGVVFKKIILTDNQDLIKDGVQTIDDEFLEWFIKNPSCESVEVVKDKIFTKYNNQLDLLGSVHIIYKIIIPKEESKQETLQQIDQNNPVTRGSTALVFKQQTVNMKTEKQKPIQLRNPNLPAFPTEFSYGDEDFTGQPIINKKEYAGITKREYFTAKALGGFMARHGAVDFSEADADRIMKAVDMMLDKCKMI